MKKNEETKNLIINGDFFEEVKKIPNNTFDLIFVDPPYWMRTGKELLRVNGERFDGVNEAWDEFESDNDYNDFTSRWLAECKRVLKPNGSLWIISGMQNVYTVGGIMQQLGFWIINDVIWYKTNPTPNFKGTRLTNSHETLIWATKSKDAKYCFNYKTAKELNTENVSDIDFSKGVRKQLGSVWKIPVCQGGERLKDESGEKLHATQKPEKLLERIIVISSKPGDYVFDPFAGTMTTGKVAKQLGRFYYMIEKDKTYYDYGTKRINQTALTTNDISLATFDIKPAKVKLTDMIKNNFLKEGEPFFFKNDPEHKAFLQKDGRVIVNQQMINIHDAVGIVKQTGIRQNGFDYWFVKRDNNFLSLSQIRNQYREFLANLK